MEQQFELIEKLKKQDRIISLETKVSGHYALRRVSAETGEVRQELEFDNLILDQGLTFFAGAVGSEDTMLRYCHVGSGSLEPGFSQLSLATRVATTDSTYSGTVVGLSEDTEYVYYRKYYQFAVGTAAGNLQEIGVGLATNNGLLSRALILDSFGVPTSITVLADEILQVRYEIRNYRPLSDVEGEFTLSGNAGDTYGYIARPQTFNPGLSAKERWYIGQHGGYAGSNTAFANAYLGDISANIFTGTPSGETRTPTINEALSYVPGSFSRSHRVYFNTTAGVGSLRSCTKCIGNTRWQFQFSKPIVKTNQQTLQLNFMHTWGRK